MVKDFLLQQQELIIIRPNHKANKKTKYSKGE